jgi:hypothetical protein
MIWIMNYYFFSFGGGILCGYDSFGRVYHLASKREVKKLKNGTLQCQISEISLVVLLGYVLLVS